MTGTASTSTSVGQNATGGRDLAPRLGAKQDGTAPPRTRPERGPRRTATAAKQPSPPATEATSDAGQQPAQGSAAERLRAAARRAKARQTGAEPAPPPPPPTAPDARDARDAEDRPPRAAAAPEKVEQAAPPAPRAGAVPALRAPRLELPRLPKLSLPRFRGPRLRLLPGVVFCLIVMLGDRSADVVVALTSDAPVSGIRASLNVEPAQAEDGPEALDGAGTDAGAVTGAAPEGEPLAAEAEPSTEIAALDTSTEDRFAGTFTLASGEEVTEGELSVLQDLSERREELGARERALTEQEALLAVAERRIDQKIEELNQLRGELEGLLSTLRTEQDEQMVSLVRIYETMRPGDAAAIFNGLDMPVLLDVLQMMSERRSAPILAAMEPERARQVTAQLALRRELPTLPE